MLSGCACHRGGGGVCARVVKRLAAAYPNQWQRIAEQLPGRDAAAVRHRWARMRTTAAAADDAEGAEGEECEEGEEGEEEEEE